MNTVAIRHELHDFIDKATDEKLGEIYAIIKEANTEESKWWEDEDMVTELERRSADLKSGKDKGVPWDQIKERLLNKNKKNGQ